MFTKLSIAVGDDKFRFNGVDKLVFIFSATLFDSNSGWAESDTCMRIFSIQIKNYIITLTQHIFMPSEIMWTVVINAQINCCDHQKRTGNHGQI